jgi:hypothetical protein
MVSLLKIRGGAENVFEVVWFHGYRGKFNPVDSTSLPLRYILILSWAAVYLVGKGNKKHR